MAAVDAGWPWQWGPEFNLVLAAVVFALSGIGAGSWSLDDAFSFDLHGVAWRSAP